MLKKTIHLIQYYLDYFIIFNSGLFDAKYYLKVSSDVSINNPVKHFLLKGCEAGLQPNAEFNAVGYLLNNPDVARSGINPFVHYIRFGKREGRIWYSDSHSRNSATTLLPTRLDELAYLEVHVEKLKKLVSENKQSPPNWFGKRVLIVADVGLSQCVKYRVFQKIEALGLAGISAECVSFRDTVRVVHSLYTCTTVIFYRLADSDMFTQYLVLARLLGVRALYDIDDPLFDQDAYAGNQNLQTLTRKERKALLGNITVFKKALLCFENVIVSTPGLKELALENGARNVVIWRNASDSGTSAAAKYALDNRVKNEKEIRIFYGSGSRAHDLDFEQVKDVLVDLLGKYENLRLTIAGFATLGEKLNKRIQQIKVVPVLGTEDYLREIAESDISIIPLLMDRFNNAKSAVRFIESSEVNVPVVASKTGDFVNLIVDGQNGFLAESQDEWRSKLVSLIESEDQRKEIAKNASSFVKGNLGVQRVAEEAMHLLV